MKSKINNYIIIKKENHYCRFKSKFFACEIKFLPLNSLIINRLEETMRINNEKKVA